MPFSKGNVCTPFLSSVKKETGYPEKKETMGERASAFASSLIPPNPLTFFQPHDGLCLFLLSAP